MSFALSGNSTNVRNLIALAVLRARFRVTSALAPSKAVARAAELFATPPRIPHPQREMELLATGSPFTVRLDGLALAAWRFGRPDRPVVLLSHGWGGRGAQLRSFVAPLVQAGYQVVLFDHVGHGHSEGTAATLVHFARGLDAVARHVEAQGATIVGVVGHSLGAAAAGAWLDESGRTLRAVIIAAPTSIERYSVLFARRVGISENVRAAMQRHFERLLGRPWKDFELPGAVARVRAEALVIHDAEDREVQARAGLQLARAWRGARYLATRGLGHRGVLRDASVVQDVVDFIAGRVVFAPPPESGARDFGAPAPLL